MKTRIALSLVLLSMLAASAAAADVRRRTVSAAPVKQAWAIEITTSGGFTGRGNGGITVSSDGRVTITTLVNGLKCTYQLDAEGLAGLDTLVQQARPEGWVASYAPANLNMRCCDIITTSLKLTRGKDQYVVDWMLPTAALTSTLDLWQILTAVTDGSASLRARYVPLCTS